MNKNPSFIGIGPPKSGSTALFHFLMQSNEVYMSKIKNPKFFYCNWKQNPEQFATGRTYEQYIKREITGGSPIVEFSEYQELFKDSNGRMSGEISPGYLLYKESPKLIYDYNPEIKLIAVLRNPVDRFFSHYNFFIQKKLETRSIEEVIKQENIMEDVYFNDKFLENRPITYIRNGLYFKNLSRYFELFPAQNIKIILYDNFRQNPQEVLNEICEFLEISKFELEDIKEHNVTMISNNQSIDSVVNAISHLKIKKYLPDSLKSAAKSFQTFINRLNQEKIKPLEDEQRQKLNQIFKSDIEKLEKLIGLDLSVWK